MPCSPAWYFVFDPCENIIDLIFVFWSSFVQESCALWAAPELITGSYDGTGFDAFLVVCLTILLCYVIVCFSYLCFAFSIVQDDVPNPTIPVFETNSQRVVNFTYDSAQFVSTTIPVRRYIFAPSNLQNASVNSVWAFSASRNVFVLTISC